MDLVTLAQSVTNCSDVQGALMIWDVLIAREMASDYIYAYLLSIAQTQTKRKAIHDERMNEPEKDADAHKGASINSLVINYSLVKILSLLVAISYQRSPLVCVLLTTETEYAYAGPGMHYESCSAVLQPYV